MIFQKKKKTLLFGIGLMAVLCFPCSKIYAGENRINGCSSIADSIYYGTLLQELGRTARKPVPVQDLPPGKSKVPESDLDICSNVTGIIKDVPEKSNVKTYMDYRCITSRTSMQYKIQQDAGTGEYGIRTVNGRYLIAVGTYYSSSIGQYIDVVLENGTVLNCMVGDIKSDRNTDGKHWQQKTDKSVIEFIVDSNVKEQAGCSGNFTDFGKFSGNIKEIFLPYQQWDVKQHKEMITDTSFVKIQ